MSPAAAARLELIDSETLLTVMVAVPKALEEEYKRVYATLGANIVAFPSESSSGEAVMGSPVCPETTKVYEEGDQVLYSLTILRGKYEKGGYDNEVFVQGQFHDYVQATQMAFRERRFVMRTWSYEPERAGKLDETIERARQEMEAGKQQLIRFCKANFGELYSGWVHLKVITAFVESVLRYGLPVNFLAVFVEPNMKREKVLKAALTDAITRLRPELAQSRRLEAEEEEEDNEDNLPYVCHKFAVIGVSRGE